MTIQESYEKWLKDFAGDAETVPELEAIRNDDKEMEDRFYTELSFGTAGMRGVLGAGMNRMNKYNVRRATKGLAGHLLENPEEAQRGVVIAYDSRRCSAEFAKDTALVLCAEGVPAYLFDALRPVPVLSYAVRHLHAKAGVVITASHNPPQYNGYKVYGEDGAQVGPEIAESITKIIRATAYTDCRLMDEQEALDKGLLKIIGNKEVDDDYVAQIKTLSINPELLRTEGPKLNIVYTPLHGSGNVPVRRVLKEIGLTNVAVVKEQEMPDPNFSTIKVPNPEDPGAYTLAFKLAGEGRRQRYLCHRSGLRPPGRGREGRTGRMAPAQRQPDRLRSSALYSEQPEKSGQAAEGRRRREEHRFHQPGQPHLRKLRRFHV